MEITFSVHGKAATAGSKRGFPFKRKDGSLGVRMVPDNERAKPWMATVASVARGAYDGPLIRGPVRLEVVFERPRPKSHYRTGKYAGQIKDSAPEYPISKPDATKLVRAVEDALTGIVWHDDSQVCSQVIDKRWGESDRTVVTIQTL